MTDLSHSLPLAIHALENVLVSCHGLAHDLRAYHEARGTVMPAFEAAEPHLAVTAALTHYGPGPAFNLWLAVRSVEVLRVAWTGRATVAETPQTSSEIGHG